MRKLKLENKSTTETETKEYFKTEITLEMDRPHSKALTIVKVTS